MKSFFFTGCITTLIVSISVLLLVLSSSSFTKADESTHTYTAGEKIPVYANKMGPFNNPLETYAYFELPVCEPASWTHKTPSIGQALVGDELYETKIKVVFHQENVDTLCSYKPTVKQIQQWTQMVEEQYWYELSIDGLPMWATFGKLIDGAPHVFTQQRLSLGYNNNRIVAANLTAENPMKITVDQTYQFTFEVSFVENPHIAFEDRFLRFQEAEFFEHSIHWFSIMNSFMMVLALSAFVVVILSRTLRSDYAKFAKEEMERGKMTAGSGVPGDEAWADETGWKQLTGDVYRVPVFPEMLCALVGQGWQLTIAAVCIVAFAVIASLHTTPGGLATYFVFIFSLTSVLSGFVGGGQFQQYCVVLPPLATQRNAFMAFSAIGFSGFVLFFGFLMNFLAIVYDSAQAISFWAIVAVFAIWLVVIVPLNALGSMWGRHRVAAQLSGKPVPHINVIPRLIPNRPWYASPEALALLGGILPFGSIFIELYYIFASFWGYKMYYVFGFLALVVVMLLLVTACSCVVVMYLLLNGEDHRWQWSSFMSGASTGIYIFCFAAYYYVFKTKMTGMFMMSFYFGYSFLMSVGVALACGAVSFSSAQMFIRAIYDRLKKD